MSDVTETPPIDEAIDRLDTVLRGAGLPGLEPPARKAPFEAISAAIAPYELPSDVRRFWERVDPERLPVKIFPHLMGPDTALQFYGERDASFLSAPPILFPIGYDSHVELLVELASEWAADPVVFRWDIVDAACSIHYRSLGSLLDVVAELVGEDLLERRGGFVMVDYAAEEEKRLARLHAAGRHPTYGDALEIPRELTAWPAHWLDASGIDLSGRVPRGATHTIADLVAAAAGGRVSGRIHGLIERAVGSSEGTLVVVDDGTRVLDVWCPAGTSPWGPVHLQRFELEVTLERPVGAPPDLDTGHSEIVRHATAGRTEAAQAAAAEFFDRLLKHEAAAVASDIRPLDQVEADHGQV